MDYIPTRLGDLIVWMANFATKLSGYASAFGLSAAEVAQVSTDRQVLEFAINGAQIRQTDAQEWTRFRDTVLFAPLGTPMPSLPTPGNVGTLPTGALASIVPRVRALVQRLKAHPNYTTAIGEDLGIEPPSVSMPDRPTLRARAETNFRVRLTFTMYRMPMLEIQSRRGSETEFTTIAFDTSSPYVDGRAPLEAGRPEIREYRARYIDRNDQPIGDWSDVVSTTAKP
ncbi:MAG: hypothetical protein KatS3mg016_0534 [Fimbriimonadales bacterium]|nr:MAG: hypothetical protein KatS3mg016_0534 [Fimbriimonadales bacterium]